MVGSKLNCIPGKQEEKNGGRMGRERGNACKHPEQRIVPVYWISVYPLNSEL